jgi:lactoylglutathione lyase
MLQEFRKEGHNAWVPEGKLGEGVSICFICKDALAIYRDVTALGNSSNHAFRRKRDVGHLSLGPRRLQA